LPQGFSSSNPIRLTELAASRDLSAEDAFSSSAADPLLGGQDATIVDDLSGTDVTQVDIDLAPAIGGVVDVLGLSTAIGINHAEVANDSLTVSTLGGDDNVVVTGAAAALIQTIVDLGSGE
jgi:hypothetical protein